MCSPVLQVSKHSPLSKAKRTYRFHILTHGTYILKNGTHILANGAHILTDDTDILTHGVHSCLDMLSQCEERSLFQIAGLFTIMLCNCVPVSDR